MIKEAIQYSHAESSVKIEIDREFQRLLMPLSGQEFSQLEENILAYGCLDPLKVWFTSDHFALLIDGHNRYEICTGHGIPFQIEKLVFRDRKVAHNWIINNQLGRRNVTPEQASYLRGKRYLSEKLAIPNPEGRNQHDEVIRQNGGQPTATRLAEEYKVSPRTIERDAEFAAAIDTIASNVGEDVRREIFSGDTNLTKQEIVQVAKLEPEQQREAIEQSKTPHVARNAGNNEWYTPNAYIEAARKVLPVIDLDPATSPIANQTVKAKKIFTVDDDGLKHGWRGNVWMNPPYASDLIGQFAAKLAQHFACGEVVQAIVLVNNATETGWFQLLAEQASAICFPKSRVRFLDPEGNPGAPLQGQALLYLGGAPEQFVQAFSDFGFVATIEV